MDTRSKGKSIDKNLLRLILVKYFNIIIALTVLAILVCGYFYFIGPKYREARAEIATLEEARQAEYNQLTNYYVKIKNYLDDYNRIKRENLEKIDRMFPGEQGSEDLFTLMEMIILKNGSIPLKISIEPKGAKVNTEPQAVAVPAEGGHPSLPVGEIKIEAEVAEVDYGGLKKLLSSIESNLRIMDIVQLDFSLARKTATFVINAYYYKD